MSRADQLMRDHAQNISDADFGRLRTLIYAQAGIILSSDKKTMLELRVRRRVRALNLHTFDQYCEYLFGGNNRKEEIVHLIDVVTTNKTDFFREPDHFEFLVQKALPDLLAGNESGWQLTIWSAGCSTGEEPYTLAMVLHEYAQTRPGFRFRVLATDISTTVLAKAARGVFTGEVAAPVPADLRRRYFMRSRDPDSNLVAGGYVFVGHSERNGRV